MSLDKETQGIYRIIDSNYNRLAEGLRVMEDIARMLFNNTCLTQQLKSLRHDLIRSDEIFNQMLLQSRDSTVDVGIKLEVAGEEKTKDLKTLLVANARRCQESLRVLEETAKMPGIELDSDKFKIARFQLYTIEKDLMSLMLRADKTTKIKGLYVIIDTSSLKGKSHLEVARMVINGGARIIQLRDKLTSMKALLYIASTIKELCCEKSVLFIINDRLDLALAVNADGIHLGQDDLPVAVARREMPAGKIIGISAATQQQAVEAEAAGADYIGFGAIYPTGTKNDAVISGIKQLQQVRNQIKIPLVAIGGINKHNIREVMDTGADSAAVINAILGAKDPEAATKELAGLIKDG